MTFYPSPDEVLAAHASLIARFGGSLGVRDRGALESALARPQSGYYEDLIQEASGLMGELVAEPSVIDGNKRVAITVTAAFLRVNGYKLAFDDLEAYSFLIQLYESGRFRFAELEAWLRSHASLAS